jgi:hypothetical protein
LSESYVPEEDVESDQFSGSDTNINIHKITVPVYAKIEYQIEK